jgi:aryl-alcohol dehydrogenase-like predicted oxidoreductase
MVKRLSLQGNCDRLVLGTAQFGMPYGVANLIGQPDPETVTSIVSAVWNCGVRFFDTAQTYGASEAILGRAFVNLCLSNEACVVTKLNPQLQTADPNAILQSLENSLKRLNVPRLWGVLLHHEDQLDHWPNGMATALSEAKRRRIIARIGISVYSPERALQALEADEVDLIQVPANIFDRRMERAGVFECAREVDKTVFVRSIYLQGLALMQPDSVFNGIPCAKEAVTALQQFCTEHRVSRQHFAMEYVRRTAPAARLILGVETVAQALENCALFQKQPLSGSLTQAWTTRWSEDIEGLIDPRKWPVTRQDSISRT